MKSSGRDSAPPAPRHRAAGTEIVLAVIISCWLPPVGEAQAAPGTNAPFSIGRMGVRPHFSYAASHSDGMQAQPGQERSTTIDTIAGGFLIELGQRWSLDYTANQTLYSDSAFTNAIDHAVVLNGSTVWGAASLNFSQNYATNSDPLNETGRQTMRETSKTSISGRRAFGQKVFVQATASQNLSFVEAAPDIYDWLLQESVHYQFSPRIDAGVGLGSGYVAIYRAADTAYLRPFVQVSWRATNKLSVSLQTMLDERLFYSTRRKWLETPVYAASISYQPATNTSLSLAANRAVSPSYFLNQVVETTGWNATLQQRLLKHFNLTAGYGNSRSEYISTVALQGAGRTDDNRTYNVGLGTTLRTRISLSASYQYGNNRSTASGFGISNRRIGGQAGIRF